ncbi:endonuclease/exonuclease/phosphatase family protein [Thermaurantimonas aggregans]|uniref:endonuclease/exonuclease/phosphatase family protein n=1 Tax=Thermaurantimonas aggregans TaxID=2173829 RepID=UPI0023F55FE2|nr:endonuclease/exonuclease/phosphatase family protein [Thermaurantimonas aggregans]MCX8147680.1 endonuclease/exonuclease/phosphatase family protein [Thermaurantimonas aggregans]
MKTLLNSLLYLLHIAIALLMLISAYSCYIPPDILKYVAIAGLMFPVLFLLNLLFGLYWLIRLRLKVLLSIITIAAVIPQVNSIFQNFLRNEEVYNSDTVTFTSFNVRLFNYWHWVDVDVKTEIPRLLDSLGTEVLGIQEFYKSQYSPDLSQFKYRHIVTGYENKDFGLAIFSKYPMRKKDFVPFEADAVEDRGGFIYSDIETKLGLIRVVCAHLVSFKLTNEDLSLVEKPDIGENTHKLRADYITLIGKINKAFEKRALQVRELKRFIADSPYPVVLLADLNDTPISYTYKVLTQHLKDPFTQAGTGIGHTYNRTRYPFRIDYVLHSPKLEAIRYTVAQRPILSDHYPVTAVLTLNTSIQ